MLETSVPEPSPSSATSLPLKKALHALLFLTVLCAIIPFSPGMPATNIDGSWSLAMNQAVGQGLAFGRDVIFSYGPYASIYTRTYHPASDALMIASSLYLALSTALTLALVTRRAEKLILVALCTVFAASVLTRDTLLYSCSLLVALWCVQDLAAPARHRVRIALTVLLFLPFGLLPLIKVSMLICCTGVVALCALFFASEKRWGQAIAAALTPALSLPLFWLASGQALADLPAFFLGIPALISGFTEAMMLRGYLSEICSFLLIGSLLLAICLFRARAPAKTRLFLSLVVALHLFLAFKGGFVRHDEHALIANNSLLAAALFLSASDLIPLSALLLIGALASWMISDALHAQTSTDHFLNNILSTYSSTWKGLSIRFSAPRRLPEQYAETLARIRKTSQIPHLKGSSDIYPVDLSALIASGNRWNPRPILQSYSAYTPSLAEANRRHLLGNGAPNNVVFKLFAIDGRIPTGEDGPSLPELLARYRPTSSDENYLYLRKVQSVSARQTGSPITAGLHAFGEKVRVPGSPDPVYVELDVGQSISGEFAGFLFKTSELRIDLDLADGTRRTFRLPSGIAKAGFILSPLLESNAEFARLYEGMGPLADKRVTSLSLSTPENERLWQGSYRIVFRPVLSLHDARAQAQVLRTGSDSLLAAADRPLRVRKP